MWHCQQRPHAHQWRQMQHNAYHCLQQRQRLYQRYCEGHGDHTPCGSHDQQIDSMVAKANTRKYFITIFKRSGAQLGDLVRCYCTFVQPLLEYAAQVWHPGLTIQRSDVLEQVQRQVLRVLLLDSSYSEARHISGLPTLPERRTKLCLNFASGLAESTDFSNWLPPRRGKCHHHNLRNKNKLSTMPTKSGRFSSRPIMFLNYWIMFDIFYLGIVPADHVFTVNAF